jgi:hypothetical protein
MAESLVDRHPARTTDLGIQILGVLVPQQRRIIILGIPILGVQHPRRKRIMVLVIQTHGDRVQIVPGSVLISTDLKGVVSSFFSSL